MILDKIYNLNKYKNINHNLKDVITYIKTNDLNNLGYGQHTINENCYLIKTEISDLKTLQTIYEKHKKYIDIHILLSGNEKIKYLNEDDLLSSNDYDTYNDVTLEFSNKSLCTINLTKQNNLSFALFFPNEWHEPKIYNGSYKITKIVIKVKAI